MKLKIKEVFFKEYCEGDDPCGGDYHGIIVEIDDKPAITYGDHYHDKGLEKAYGFLEGYQFAKGKRTKIETDNVILKEADFYNLLSK